MGKDACSRSDSRDSVKLGNIRSKAGDQFFVFNVCGCVHVCVLPIMCVSVAVHCVITA